MKFTDVAAAQLYMDYLTELNMYSLDCLFYEAKFRTIDELVLHAMLAGVDPNYEVTFNGKGIGEMLIDFIKK